MPPAVPTNWYVPRPALVKAAQVTDPNGQDVTGVMGGGTAHANATDWIVDTGSLIIVMSNTDFTAAYVGRGVTPF